MTNSAAPTILLIDDDHTHLQIESILLNRLGYRIVTSLVGRESFTLPDGASPGLIFLDYRLNCTVTSKQIASLLRETFPNAAIILLSSADAMPEEMARLVDGFITKADPEKLVDFARRHFSGDGNASVAHPLTP